VISDKAHPGGCAGQRPGRGIDRKNVLTSAIAADPAVASRLAAVGQIARGSTPAEFAASIEEQRLRIAAVAKALASKNR
jgi:tripartite-type tricarboxylate transporter receptor subunit TctC